jgi:hypothetical protein
MSDSVIGVAPLPPWVNSLDVGEADVAQARQRQHLADRLGDQREQVAR